jgi:hypothetical protein
VDQSHDRRAGRAWSRFRQADSLIIANKRNSVMEMSTIKFEVTDEEILGYDVADEALEAAACGNEKAGAITLAFCSGLDTCPA